MTAAEINALPDRVRSYIHELETRCDPAGDLRELVYSRERIEQLEVALRIKHENLQSARFAFWATLTALFGFLALVWYGAS